MRRKLTRGTAIAGIVGVTMALGIGSASALNRVSCTSYQFLWLDSNQTTCWANAGSTTVALYSVYGLSAGNNAGELLDYSGNYIPFIKGQHNPIPIDTIQIVTIN